MPELPEVETVCRCLKTQLLGPKITSVVIRKPKLRYPIPKKLSKILPGKTIKKISRRGKYILLTTEVGTLIIHLGMSGTLQIKTKKHPITKHEHFSIIFSNNKTLCYNDPRRFGVILWTEKDPLQHPLLKKLGPEPLTKKFTVNYLLQQKKLRSSPIKQFIMNSNIISGIGNIYANEILFASKINPGRKVNSMSQNAFQKLIKETQRILKLAIKYGGTTIKDHTDSSGNKGLFQKKLKVYGRENKACYKCKTKLVATKLGQRVTVFCPRCQK